MNHSFPCSRRQTHDRCSLSVMPLPLTSFPLPFVGAAVGEIDGEYDGDADGAADGEADGDSVPFPLPPIIPRRKPLLYM